VKLWEVATGQLKKTLNAKEVGNLCAIAFTPDGSLLAVCSSGKMARLWRTTSLWECTEIAGEDGKFVPAVPEPGQ